MSKKRVKKRRIVKAEVTFLSLVPRGANRLTTLYKDDGTFEMDALVKMGEDGELYACVYAPEIRDSQGDIASDTVCKQMAYSFTRNGAHLDIRHDGKAVGIERAYAAESFLIQKGDPRFAGLADRDGTPVDPTGGWGVVVKLEDPELRAKYASKEWDGVSLGGTAQVVVTDKEEKEQTVDAKELAAILAKSNAELAKSITDTIVTALKPVEKEAPAKDEDAPETAPVFKGDPLDAKAVTGHVQDLRRWKLLKETDWTDADAVAKLQESLTKSAEKEAPADGELVKSTREIELETELAGIRKQSGASNQSGAPGQLTAQQKWPGMEKEDAEAYEAGLAANEVVRKEEEARR